MKHKILSIVYLILCTASSSLSAEASETSEERQRDTFTLYDRNRREVNWQRQQRQARDSREARDRYHRNNMDYSQQNTRQWNGPVHQDRNYSQQNTRQWNGPVNQDRGHFQQNTRQWSGSTNQDRGYYDQQPSREHFQAEDRGYYRDNVRDGDLDYVRTNPKYSQIPAVPPIE